MYFSNIFAVFSVLLALTIATSSIPDQPDNMSLERKFSKKKFLKKINKSLKKVKTSDPNFKGWKNQILQNF